MKLMSSIMGQEDYAENSKPMTFAELNRQRLDQQSLQTKEAPEPSAPLNSTNTTRPYNILSIDGGGVRNLITLKGLEYMEQFACQYSMDQRNKITGINCTD
jgi:hypothetical protein